MKRIFTTTIAASLLALSASPAFAACETIQDGTLLNSEVPPQVIFPGYDDWGYNYQAQMFNGGYCDAYRDAGWCQAYADDDLMMKWNTAWLSNKDCDNDGLLDRHPGSDSYIGSGAWLTNHMSGKVEVNGKMRKWTYFVKIVAAPDDATVNLGKWYAADGTEIGPVIWGAFAVIQEIVNDPSSGAHGVLYKSPIGPGFGHIDG